MSIKPVLVPDHDAAALRGLMDRFAEATTGPTRQQLAESRAAVAAAQGVAEGEGMSRAAKGYEKYGKAGMAALAKAGREGQALDPVRDRYNKYDEAVAEDRTEVKDAEGRVKSWRDESEWTKSEKKDPRGKVTNLSDKARRETEKTAAADVEESIDPIEQLRADILRFSR